MSVKKKSLRISSIRQAASSIPGAPGNLLINTQGEAKPENWFSSREWRNFMSGAGLNPDLPVVLFRGSTLTYEELTITPDMINMPSTANPEVLVYRIKLNGREVEYKQPGVHNINLSLDLNTVPAEILWGVAELSMKFRRPRQVGVGTTVAPAAVETLDEATESPTGEAVASTVEDLVDNTDANSVR